MKLKAVFHILFLSTLVVSCGDNSSDRKESTNQKMNNTITSGGAMFPYFEKARALNVRKRYTYGYLTKTGKRATGNHFSEAHTFTDGLGCVGIYRNRKYRYGYIDPSGKYKIKPIYKNARPFQEERAVVCNDSSKWMVINKNGVPLTDAKFDIISDYYNGSCYGYVYKRTDVRRGFFGGRREESYYDCYRIDKSGKEELIGEDIESLHHRDLSKASRMNHLVMYWEDDTQGNRLYGFKKIKSGEFKQSPFSECGNYRKEGTVHIPAKFISAECFEGGYARVELSSGQSAFIDTEGNVVCTFTDDR